MATEKIVSYTPELTADVVKRYTAGEAVADIAAAVGRTVASVIAKLSREGVYKSPKAVAKAKGLTKAGMIASIAASVGVAEEVLESLEKATSPALAIVMAALAAKAAE
jgi:hypothetical protein